MRVTRHPAICKFFPTKLEAEPWASRIEAAIRGRTLALARDMTVAQLTDEGTPRLVKPVSAAFAYWSACRSPATASLAIRLCSKSEIFWPTRSATGPC